MAGESEAPRRISGKGGEDLPVCQSRPRHERKFRRGVEMISVANICAKQYFPARLRVSAEFRDHFVDPGLAFLVRSLAPSCLKIEKRQGRYQREICSLQSHDKLWGP